MSLNYPPSRLTTRRQVSLNKIVHSVQAGNCCRILGPRYRAKSKLMREAASFLKKGGTHITSYQSLRDVTLFSEQSYFAGLYADVLLVSESDFFTSLYFEIERDLLSAGALTRPIYPDSAFEFQQALISLIRQSDHNLALFIDDLEAAPPNLVASLLGALRAIFMTLINQPGPQFQAVVCGSLSFSQVALDSASHFESISDLVVVDDLDDIERFLLLDRLCQKAQLTPGPLGLETLLEQTGGNYFFIERVAAICFEEMKATGKTTITPARIAEAVELFLNMPLEPPISEALQQIEGDPALLSCTLIILERGEVSGSELPIVSHETPTPLELCGIFSKNENNYRIKCPLWIRILHQHLTPARVGSLYAIAGYWKEAMKYLGQAICQGQPAVKSQLFTAVINAMHASQNASEAFAYLAEGLQAAYPDCFLRLYHQTDATLNLVYSSGNGEVRRQILLRHTQCPEVKALRGPNYSITSIAQDTHLLIPLRVDHISANSIGLVSLSNLVSQNSPYRQREELLELIGFLHKAARVIEARGIYAQLLSAAEMHADKLSVLNTILTRILHDRDHPEEVILRLVLAGITSGWGLEFNRAVLFMPDTEERFLIGRFGVGHLTREQAEADWETFPFRDVNELIEHLLLNPGQETPLHRAIDGLAISLEAAQDNLLVKAYRGRHPIQNTRFPSYQEDLPDLLIQAIHPYHDFALIPLATGEQVSGILYVDNKFTERPITPERFELLQTFVNQATLVLENAQALATEKKRTATLTLLLKVEEAINSQITRSVQELLVEIVRSACCLTGADCAVLYPFHPTRDLGHYSYEVDHIACWQTWYDVKPSEKPRPSQGIASLIVEQGEVHIADVTTSIGAYGRKIIDSPFIRREKIKSFIGMRLGPAEEPVGILYFNWRSPKSLTSEELTIIEVYANFAAVAIPTARRHEEIKDDLRRRKQELESLSQIFYAGLESRSEEKVEEVIKRVLETAQEFTGAPYLYLIRNESRGVWRSFYLRPDGNLNIQRQEVIPGGILLAAFSQGEAQHVESAGPLADGKFLERLHSDSHSALAIPVKVTRYCLGVLYLESPLPKGLLTNHIEFLERLASRLALTLEQAELSQALRQLLDISSQLTQGIGLQDVLFSLVEQAMDAMRAVDAITLYYVDRETGKLVLGHMAGVHDELAVRRHPTRRGRVIDRIWQADEPVFADNVAANELLNGNFARREGVQSAAAFPLKVKEERVGCMFFNYRFHHPFVKGEKSLLNIFAQLAAFAIHQAILYDDAERRRQRLETVARITPMVSATLDLNEVFRTILSEVKQVVPRAQNACIVQFDETEQQLTIPPISLEFYQVDQVPEQGAYQVATLPNRSIARRVIQSGEAVIVPDVRDDPDYFPAIASTRSELCVPIEANGRVNAALVLESDQPNAFVTDDQLLLEMLADHVAIAMQNAKQFSELEEAQRELRLARDRELRERIATLATGLIHDINKAVANIPDLVDEIEEKLQVGSDIAAPVSNLRRSALATGRISSRLRNFVIAKQLQLELTNLNILLENVLNVMQSQKPDHITLAYRNSGSLPLITADSSWLELLLENLITNAYEAILAKPDQSGIVEIEVEVEQSTVCIRVRDNGKGIAPEDRALIFEPGYTTKGRSGLHGIGLYHCQQIVQEHSGQLTVDSIPGTGSVFTVTLPRN